MAHVFLSYSHNDMDQAKQLATRLEANGLAVWWDRTIPPGRTFDEVIEEALDAASWVIVLWSATSIKSNWVKSEAEEALRRGILVPVLIEDVRIPLAFRRIEASELQRWDGDANPPEFRQLVRVLSGKQRPRTRTREASSAKRRPPPGAPAQSTTTSQRNRKVGWGIAGAIVVGGIALASAETDDYPPRDLPPAVPTSTPTGGAVFDDGIAPTGPTGRVTLRYLGDNLGCALDLQISVGGQTVVPTSNMVAMTNVPLGDVAYTVAGTIACPTVGQCAANGSGRLHVIDGGTYDLSWLNTTFGQCAVVFSPSPG